MSEHLQDMEEWGKLLLTQEESARALGISYEDFIENEDLVSAYERGRMITISTHKKKIISLANQGSGPAQTHLEKLKMEQEIERIKNAWG